MPIRTIGLPLGGLDDHDSVTIDDQHCANLRNVRSLRDRIETAPGGTLLAPAPTPGVNPGFGMTTGSFVMNTSTGAQTVTHNLGATPVALILWTEGSTALNTKSTSVHWGLGMTDGTDTRSAAFTSIAGGTSATGRRYSTSFLVIVNQAGTAISSATFTSWNSTTFIINWGTVDGVARRIEFSIFGHASLSAKLVEWTFGTSTGNQAVAGVGFTPSLVLHLTAAEATATGGTGAQWGFGMMAAGTQYATSAISQNGVVGHNGHSQAGASIIMLNASGSAVSYAASYVSMDVDGFTVNRTTAPGTGQLVASLCFSGFTNVRVRNLPFTSTTVPQRASVTGFGFQPSGMFFVGGGTDENNKGFELIAGAADGTNQVNAACEDDIGNSGQIASTVRTDAVYIDAGLEADALDRKASLISFDSDGITINITVGPAPNFTAVVFSVPGTLAALGVIRNYGDLIVGGVVPTEKIVMLTSKSAFVYAPSTSTTGIFGSTAETYTGTDVQRFSIANGTDSSGALAAWSQGKDAVRKYNGTAFSGLITSGTNHAARTLLPFNNRLVTVRPFFGGVDYKTQIRFSVNGNYSDFSGIGSGTLEVVETSNQPLTGGIVLGNRCYLTRARETIELIASGSLTPVFIPEVKVSGIGCIATHSMAAGDIYAFWLGPDEIYQWDGAQLKAVGGRTYNTITALVDYENLDQIQATVYEPDSQYHLVVPPYRFVYDYRRDIWDWDDTRSFQAIGRLTVADLITGDLDHSEFTVIGDSSVQTIRDDPSVNTYLGMPIDAYFETGDKLPLGTGAVATGAQGRQYEVVFDRLNSVYRVWFRGTPGEVVEVGVSVDKGLTYTYAAQPTTQVVTVNSTGVGVAFFVLPWGTIRLRLRSQAGSVYSIQGALQIDFGESGMNLPG